MTEISQCLKCASESLLKGKHLVECISGNLISESCTSELERVYQNQQMLTVWEVSGVPTWIQV